MTADELDAFLADVRAECDQRLAMLAAVDPQTLPAELRDEYDSALRNWTALRELTEGDAHEFHVAVREQAGRELTPDELRALLGLIPPQRWSLHPAVPAPRADTVIVGAADDRPARGVIVHPDALLAALATARVPVGEYR